MVYAQDPFLLVCHYTINASKDWTSECIFCNNLLTCLGENIGVLDPVNEKHLFALYYVYLPLINRALEQFMETWNSHPMRTFRNMSPLQIWRKGFYRL